MKKIKFLALGFVILLNEKCSAQSNYDDKQVISMLKEFYVAYGKYSFKKEYFHKTDSIKEKYCTQQFRERSKEYLQDDHDLLTNDWGISEESIPSMKIEKSITNKNGYIISYVIDSYPVSSSAPIKKRISLHVMVVKEKNEYKINDVE